jgi:thioredoxin-dependent peroxiredoxin
VVLGVSPDSVESHGKFIQKNKIAVMLLSDSEHAVIKAYDAWGTKKMYGKEFEGVVRSTVLIDPKGLVKTAWPKASSKGHAAEVLEALQRLAA